MANPKPSTQPYDGMYPYDLVVSNNGSFHVEQNLMKEINKIDNVDKIELENIETLTLAFRTLNSDDPYAVSPAYYALTGRRGLWLYKDTDFQGKQTFCLFCLHPNLLNSIVVFPAFGHAPLQATTNLVDKLSTLNADIQIGRVQNDSALHSLVGNTNNHSVSPVEENVLDWSYPLHTIDCSALVERKGKEYRRIRLKINKFERSFDVKSRLIDFNKDFPTIKSIYSAWEDTTTHYDNYDITFTNYFKYLFEMATHCPHIGINGLILSVNGVDRGFTMWEYSPNQSNVANVFASQVSDTAFRNITTYQTVETAKALLEDNAHYMCLGGSESEGMDIFKRSFIPALSKDLKTLEVKRVADSKPSLIKEVKEPLKISGVKS